MNLWIIHCYSLEQVHGSQIPLTFLNSFLPTPSIQECASLYPTGDFNGFTSGLAKLTEREMLVQDTIASWRGLDSYLNDKEMQYVRSRSASMFVDFVGKRLAAAHDDTMKITSHIRYLIYGECASIARILLPEENLQCRFWLVPLLQKLITLRTGVDLCNITGLPTCSVLNVVRSSTGHTRGTYEDNRIVYGKRTLLEGGLEERNDCEMHAMIHGYWFGTSKIKVDPTGPCIETNHPPPMTKSRFRGLQVGSMSIRLLKKLFDPGNPFLNWCPRLVPWIIKTTFSSISCIKFGLSKVSMWLPISPSPNLWLYQPKISHNVSQTFFEFTPFTLHKRILNAIVRLVINSTSCF